MKHLKLVVNRKEEPVTQREYDEKVKIVWAFAMGVMGGLAMAAWMALGR